MIQHKTCQIKGWILTFKPSLVDKSYMSTALMVKSSSGETNELPHLFVYFVSVSYRDDELEMLH